MINFVVCDDDKEQRAYTASLIDTHCQQPHTVSTAASKSELLDILKSVDVDIIFMDIIFSSQKETGIDIIKEIQKSHPDIIVVFVSGHDTYHEYVYEAEHIYFLKKPYNAHHFKNALDKAVSKSRAAKSDFFILRTRSAVEKFRYGDILYFESSGHIVNIYFSDGSVQQIHGVKLSDMEKGISKQYLSRCHQSYIVNISKIKKIEKNTVYLDNGDEVPVSKRYAAEINNLFALYLGDILW